MSSRPQQLKSSLLLAFGVCDWMSEADMLYSPLVSKLKWELAPRFALGEPRGGTGGGTLCFCEPFKTAGKAISDSFAAEVILIEESVAFAAVETGDVAEVGVV